MISTTRKVLLAMSLVSLSAGSALAAGHAHVAKKAAVTQAAGGEAPTPDAAKPEGEKKMKKHKGKKADKAGSKTEGATDAKTEMKTGEAPKAETAPAPATK
jgi:hypothetical protein